MKISIGNLWAVAYINNLSSKIEVHSKLFSSREEAENFGKEFCINYVVSPVFFENDR